MATPLNLDHDSLSDVQPTQAIKGHLDDFAGGRLSADELTGRLRHLCAGHSESAWEALSLLDQYNRRGLIPAELFRGIKSAIHGVVFGSLPASRSEAFFGPTDSSGSVQMARVKNENSDAQEDEREYEDGEEEQEYRLAAEETPHALRQRPATTTIVFDRDAASDATEPPSAHTNVVRMRAGAVLGDRYVLIAPLGRGGMSTVFKALDRERTNLPEQDRYVAIKLLRDEITARPDARAALRREFKQAQLLSHPNIVRVYDCDAHAGHHFIVMELLSGELLERVLERLAPRKLALSDAFAVIREIGVALAHAHDHGVVHGDLKPGNVMLTDTGELRILDFGLSSSLLPGPWISDEPREQPLVAFTPGYASPERIRGVSPDSRDDLYSLACIAFELVTGQPVAPTGKPLTRRRIVRALNAVRELSPRQRRTIVRGLATHRARRPPAVRSWLADFDLSKAARHLSPVRDLHTQDARRYRSRVWKGVLALILLAVASTLVARIVLQNVQETLPSVPAATPQNSAGREKAVSQPAAQNTEVVRTPLPTSPTSTVDEAVPSRPIAPTEPAWTASADKTPQTTSSLKPVSGPPSLVFSEEEYTVPTTGSVARLTVKRNGSVDKETIFHWRTIGGSARPERDYVSFDDAAERLAPGQRSTQILIPIVNDSQRHGTEYFEVELTDAASATLGTISRATVVIVGED